MTVFLQALDTKDAEFPVFRRSQSMETDLPLSLYCATDRGWHFLFSVADIGHFLVSPTINQVCTPAPQSLPMFLRWTAWHTDNPRATVCDRTLHSWLGREELGPSTQPAGLLHSQRSGGRVCAAPPAQVRGEQGREGRLRLLLLSICSWWKSRDAERAMDGDSLEIYCMGIWPVYLQPITDKKECQEHVQGSQGCP